MACDCGPSARWVWWLRASLGYLPRLQAWLRATGRGVAGSPGSCGAEGMPYAAGTLAVSDFELSFPAVLRPGLVSAALLRSMVSCSGIPTAGPGFNHRVPAVGGQCLSPMPSFPGRHPVRGWCVERRDGESSECPALDRQMRRRRGPTGWPRAQSARRSRLARPVWVLVQVNAAMVFRSAGTPTAPPRAGHAPPVRGAGGDIPARPAAGEAGIPRATSLLPRRNARLPRHDPGWPGRPGPGPANLIHRASARRCPEQPEMKPRAARRSGPGHLAGDPPSPPPYQCPGELRQDTRRQGLSVK
jgi:hypothetical protein